VESNANTYLLRCTELSQAFPYFPRLSSTVFDATVFDVESMTASKLRSFMIEAFSIASFTIGPFLVRPLYRSSLVSTFVHFFGEFLALRSIGY